mmetsp:Transcript_11748/g.24769  ORF Transcript_11748/g.24769 Transcript_11748/m.24769 type:complete len:233 (-) Transcript_11748:381-1079(-)
MDEGVKPAASRLTSFPPQLRMASVQPMTVKPVLIVAAATAFAAAVLGGTCFAIVPAFAGTARIGGRDAEFLLDGRRQGPELEVGLMQLHARRQRRYLEAALPKLGDGATPRVEDASQPSLDPSDFETQRLRCRAEPVVNAAEPHVRRLHIIERGRGCGQRDAQVPPGCLQLCHGAALRGARPLDYRHFTRVVLQAELPANGSFGQLAGRLVVQVLETCFVCIGLPLQGFLDL